MSAEARKTAASRRGSSADDFPSCRELSLRDLNVARGERAGARTGCLPRLERVDAQEFRRSLGLRRSTLAAQISMNSQPGPSCPPSTSGGVTASPSTSSSSSSGAAASSSSAVAQGAAGGRPSAFSTATRPASGAPTAQSAVARGKQPAASVNTARSSVTAPNTATGSTQRQGTAATPGSTNAGAAPGGAAVSVGGPAGLVRRTVLNSILVNTRQVRREATLRSGQTSETYFDC